MTKIGERYTKQRKIIFEAMENFATPVTVKQIEKYLNDKKINIDVASIYRNLTLMKNADILAEVEFGEGKKRYELIKDHHHHLICEHCGQVADVTMKEESLIKNVKNKSGFMIKKHRLEFFGLCPRCQ